MLAGVPVDFRLDYGRQFHRDACIVSANRDKADLTNNRKPDIGLQGDPGIFLQMLAETAHSTAAVVRADGTPQESGPWSEWHAYLRAQNDARDADITEQAQATTRHVNPLRLFQTLDGLLPENALLVADGGDFVGTAAYILQPRSPLSWLDPGPFGTLGVGAGFALGAKLVRPDAEIWIIYGDGSAGYSLTEFDTFVRHGIPVIAVVGNDAGWSQIAREQVEILHDDVGTVLRHTDYHRVAEGLGGAGFLVDKPDAVDDALQEARALAAGGQPVLINVILDKSDFRKGSLSM
jgi:thiamine pyrophosphate-dependent acetolactate synthase large subunit-like protein